MNYNQLLEKLCEAEGMTLDEFLDKYAIDSVVPGICRDPDCLFVVTSCEPDADHNWCEGCGENTVISGIVLAGII